MTADQLAACIAAFEKHFYGDWEDPYFRDEREDWQAAWNAAMQAVQPVSGVVIRDGLPTLLQDKHITSHDQRVYTLPKIENKFWTKP